MLADTENTLPQAAHLRLEPFSFLLINLGTPNVDNSTASCIQVENEK